MPIQAKSLRPGMFVMYNNDICQVMKSQHRTPGNLRAFMQATLRNLKVGNQYELRFSPADTLEEVRLEERAMQFLYEEGDSWVFMDSQNYEQVSITKELLGDAILYILPEAQVHVTFHEGNAIGVRPPKIVELKVVETEPNIKGGTATSSYKPAKVETGLIVKVPGFITEGDVLRIDTETQDYLERAKK